DARARPDLSAALLDAFAHLFVEHAGAEARVHELVHERLDRLLRLEEGVHDGGREAQALDPLRGPVRSDLLARDAPYLLSVGLEEGLVEFPAEAIDDPVLERLDVRGPGRSPDARDRIAREDLRAVQDTHPEERVQRSQRVVEVFLAVIDPGE